MCTRAFITGVSGFVGGFLAEHLLEQGDRVLGSSPDGKWEAASSPSVQRRMEPIAWQLADDDGLARQDRSRIEAFAPDVIYHLAAISIPRECGQHQPTPLATAVNVDGTRRLLQLASELPARPRIVFISSSHVYAPPPPSSPSARLDEDAPLGPTSGYGRTKLDAEQLVREAVQRRDCQAIVVRAFQHTGPRQTPSMMLPEWARQFTNDDDTPIKVHTLDARIDLADVRDVVRAYRLLGERGRSGQTYNVASGTARSTGEIFSVLQRLAGSTRPAVELHGGFKQDPIADIGRLVRATGWAPRIPLEQTVGDVLAYWREQTTS